MKTPTPTHEYYPLTFAQELEAAAFIAALSRFLSYPQGQTYRTQETQLEVWSHKATGEDGVTIYLSESALEATSADFAPVPVAATILGVKLPNGCKLLLSEDLSPVWGLTGALEHL